MPKPSSKKELVQASQESFNGLNELIASLPSEWLSKEFPFQHRDRTVRDVLAHLYEWQLMMLNWYQVGMAGSTPEMPSPGHTWKTTPQLNAEIWAKYQKTPFKKVQTKLVHTHNELLNIVGSHSNRELFTKRLYDWTGSTSLGSYLTSSLWSHYQWAIKLIRRLIRSIQ